MLQLNRYLPKLRIAVLAAALLVLPAIAEDELDWAFLKAMPAKKEKGKAAKGGKDKDAAAAGPERLWIRLTPYQERAVQKKSKVQNRQLRRDDEREEQSFPIELSPEQITAICKAIDNKKGYAGKILLRTVFADLEVLNSTRGKHFYIVRSVEQFKRADPSDPADAPR